VIAVRAITPFGDFKKHKKMIAVEALPVTLSKAKVATKRA
jgi:hypothetical protein